MASYKYAIYKFDDFTIAKKIPREGSAEKIFESLYSEPNSYLEELDRLVEDIEVKVDFVGIKKKPLCKMTIEETKDLYNALECAKYTTIMYNYLLDLLFFNRYKDNFVKVVFEGDDDFEEQTMHVDVWMD